MPDEIVTPLKVASRVRLYMLWTQVCRTQHLSLINAEGNWPRGIPACTILPACSTLDQASSWQVFGWNLRHCTYGHYGSELRSYTDSWQSSSYYHCSEVSRAGITRLVHGTRSPLNYVSGLILFPPRVTCIGVTALSIPTHCTYYFSLVTSP
jgi:hypothetical protein